MSSLPAASNEGHSDRILALDGLRGVAILIVTLYRFAKEAFPAELVGATVTKIIALGALGVDLFFVLSGFLITGILLRSKGREHYFSRFYYRRSLRIFPLYFVTLAVLLVLAPLIMGNASLFSLASKNQFFLWTYTTNLKMSWENQWCFGYLDHLWSLAVEEQFYLAWPLVVYFASARLLKVSLAGVALCVFSRGVFCAVSENGVAPDVFTLFRFDGLLLGAVVAVLWNRDSRLSTIAPYSLPGFAAASAIVMLAGVMGKRFWELPQLFVAAAWACLLVMILLPGNSTLQRLMQSRFLGKLGQYSYAMYIFQSPLIPILKPVFGVSGIGETIDNPLLAGAIYVLIMSCITYLAAHISWHAFESVILRLRDSWPSLKPEPALQIAE